MASSTEGSAPARLEWVDVAKGLGIALVVLGHTLRGLVNAGLLNPEGPVQVVDRWIYAFHMPLFFILSGLFLARSAERPLRSFVADKLLRLGYPYLVWVTLQTLIMVALSRYTNHPSQLSDLARAVYQPPMQFWFFYALLLQSLIFGLLWSTGMGRGGVLVVSLLAWVSARWIPAGTWPPFLQARDYFPYLAIGVLLGRPDVMERIGAMSRAWAAGIGVAGFGVVTALLRLDLLEQREAGMAAALAGSAAVVALSSAVARRGVIPAVSLWGKESLAIYCAHTLASAGVRIGLKSVLHVANPGIHLALGALVGLYGPLALVWLSKRFRFPYLFELPRRRAPEAKPAT
jgi:fucose 4-O-acetylase-like acetyltransferase